MTLEAEPVSPGEALSGKLSGKYILYVLPLCFMLSLFIGLVCLLFYQNFFMLLCKVKPQYYTLLYCGKTCAIDMSSLKAN